MSPPFRVAVTRDEGPDGPLSSALRHLGLEPVPVPAVREEPAPDAAVLAGAARDLERYDWLIVSSGRAVEALVRARGGRSLPLPLRTAAVGTRTAAALRAAGAESVLLAETAGSLPLLDTLRRMGGWYGRRVLMPRAEEGGRALATGLRVLGAVVDEVVAYRTVARPAEEIAGAWRAAEPDAAVVASSSAARALVAALGAGPLVALRVLVALGEPTRAALAEHRVQAAMPRRTDFEGAAGLVALRLPGGERS